MTITLDQATTYAQHFLGGDPEVETLAGLVNEAGRETMNMAGWLWAEAVSGTADFVEDQDYADLPASFLRFSSTPRLSGGSQSRLLLVSVNRLETLRIGGSAVGEPSNGAVMHAIDDNGLVVPRLSLYPTPNADAEPGLLFTYSRGWTDLVDDADIVPIPVFMEPVFRDVLRAVARGWEDDLANPGIKQTYLATVLDGPSYRKARETDRAFQQSYGPIRGGVGSVGGFDRISVTVDGSLT